ncbi:MAG: amino acid adenylation domain-containing protein [Chromatiales bacterium]|nr:amino acid adenylation domain-containing protein [Chromatiales bacterium]
MESAAAGLVQAVWRHACERPSAPAILDGPRSLDYAGLERAATTLAAKLRDAGMGPGRLVAILLPHALDYVVAMLAVRKTGAAWMPLDTSLPASRLDAMLRIVPPDLLLGQAKHADVAWHGPRLDWSAAAPAGPVATVACASAPGDTAYVMFTSGSAGQPRAVRVLERNLAGLFPPLTQALSLGAGDRWSWLHSCAFGYSVWELFGALLHGACLVVVPPERRRDPGALVELLLQARVTVLSLTPTALRTLLGSSAAARLAPADLRLVSLSGEPVRAAELEAWFSRYPEGGPRLVSSYALTETGGQVCLHEHRASEHGAGRIPLGYPLAGRELLLLDEAGRPLAGPGRGEICVAGDCVAAGYPAEPELTARRFVEIEVGGRRLPAFRTGDLAQRDKSGLLEFAGRLDTQFKHHGYRIEPSEIEDALRAHPSIRDAAVGLREDPAGESRLVAWLEHEADVDSGVEFWPSLGGYQVYDPLLYDLMGVETTRVAAYRDALARTVAGRAVLDMGTGRDALLARLAAAAGARHVYAVELQPEAAASARTLVAQLGLEARITVIEADAASLDLPEPVEVLTQGIIGNIGSADGIVALWNAIQPALADDCVAVPERCTTRIAAVELPAAVRASPRFAALARPYLERLFGANGEPFDVRLCVRGLPPEQLISDVAEFEVLDFSGSLETTFSGAATLRIARDGLLDGLLLWTVVGFGAGASVDYLEAQQAWLPVLLPLGDSGPVPVQAGDCLELHWHIGCESDPRCPDYRISATLQGALASRRLEHVSRQRETSRGANPLHRALLDALAAPAGLPSVDSLRDWLAAQLPAWMLPAAWVPVARLPVSASGKLDRRALPEPGWTRPALEQAPVAAADALEADLIELWQQVLPAGQIGVHDDFFALGGDSIAAVQLTTGLQRLLDHPVMLTALFEAPTIAGLAQWLRREHPEPVSRRYPVDAARAAG